MSPVGSPGVTSRQVRPPSVDLWMPEPGPPASSDHTVRRRSYVAAYMMSGSTGSNSTSVTPVSSSTVSTAAQEAPPSSVRYSPRSPPADHSGPSAATNTVLPSRGSTRILPMCSEAASPTRSQVRPAVPAPVDAVPPRHVPPAHVFAGPDPHDVGVGGVDGDRTDGVRRLIVKDGRPGDPRIHGLPDAARSDRDVPGGRVVGVDRDVRDAPSHERRADSAQREPLGGLSDEGDVGLRGLGGGAVRGGGERRQRGDGEKGGEGGGPGDVAARGWRGRAVHAVRPGCSVRCGGGVGRGGVPRGVEMDRAGVVAARWGVGACGGRHGHADRTAGVREVSLTELPRSGHHGRMRCGTHGLLPAGCCGDHEEPLDARGHVGELSHLSGRTGVGTGTGEHGDEGEVLVSRFRRWCQMAVQASPREHRGTLGGEDRGRGSRGAESSACDRRACGVRGSTRIGVTIIRVRRLRPLAGNQIMDWAIEGYDPLIRYGQSDHSFGNIWTSLERVFRQTAANEARTMFAGYLVLDALIGNTDRHHENWAILGHRVEGRWRRRLAPSFDHASSLGRELLDDRRTLLLREKRVGWYSERGRGGIYWGRHPRTAVSPIDLARRAVTLHPASFEGALVRLAALRDGQVTEIVNRVPSDWMSPQARAFAVDLIIRNRERLMELGK